MTHQRYCLALDLVDDPEKIQTYIAHHRNIWPEVQANIYACGIVDMQIWHIGTRLFMVMEVDDTYSPQHAAAIAATEPRVKEWETLMWQFQIPTPWTPAGEKWVAMEKIFDLKMQ
ncbi:MAG: L-rhamnose mutarotase [Advenella sp.]|uniref:L-fucose mutarotase n=1 Tax=Advenella kashmirensis TaxID=310575 RepID=A0A356LEQ9_9BURK|nr:L-rhamnose mutarotase [Advenella sp. FME57]HBP29500.1 L-fucose mutarotase [Advenella kashmirensis]